MEMYALKAKTIEEFNRLTKLFKEKNEVKATQTHVGYNVSGEPTTLIAIMYYEAKK